ncbi:MAG: SAM-dependent methyltransferase, partial [Bacteroidota bacterium]
IHFDFETLRVRQNWTLTDAWDLERLQGYLNTWSGVRRYIGQNSGSDPVGEVIKAIVPFWGKGEQREVQFPIFLKLWKITKP